MEGQRSGGILKKSPLGCILAHWKDIGGLPGGNVNRKTLIKYCNQWWPLYKLEDGEKWPFNRSLNCSTILQLMLFLWREGKWDEVMYADMFFTLQNHPEWQRDCRIDIRKKLQRLKELDIRDLEKLLEEAWRVFRNWEDVDRGKLMKVMAIAKVAALEQRGMVNRGGFRG